MSHEQKFKTLHWHAVVLDMDLPGLYWEARARERGGFLGCYERLFLNYGNPKRDLPLGHIFCKRLPVGSRTRRDNTAARLPLQGSNAIGLGESCNTTKLKF